VEGCLKGGVVLFFRTYTLLLKGLAALRLLILLPLPRGRYQKIETRCYATIHTK
jgi:hypothetical protein